MGFFVINCFFVRVSKYVFKGTVGLNCDVSLLFDAFWEVLLPINIEFSIEGSLVHILLLFPFAGTSEDSIDLAGFERSFLCWNADV
jgi:hypothetical protein